jgi:RNA polymerase sigma-70 factor, ECF subfamily
LRGPPTQARDAALATLHQLLLRATRFVLSRRRDQLNGLGTAEVDDLAVRAADDALMSILRALDDFHGASRFTTWAYKFAVHEAVATVRRRASQVRQDTALSAPRLPSMQRSSSA